MQYTGATCPPLAKEQLVTSGGATNNPINSASGPMLLSFDQSRHKFCPSELTGDEITITGRMIVRRTDPDSGAVTCELCPEAECYMWLPNISGSYAWECSGRCGLLSSVHSPMLLCT